MLCVDFQGRCPADTEVGAGMISSSMQLVRPVIDMA